MPNFLKFSLVHWVATGNELWEILWEEETRPKHYNMSITILDIRIVMSFI